MNGPALFDKFLLNLLPQKNPNAASSVVGSSNPS